MIKKLASHLGEYRRAALLTPMFSALEAVMDILLPTIMAFIIDLGIEKGDMNAIVKYGLLTFAVAAIALLLGVLAVACIATFGVLRFEEHQEQIKAEIAVLSGRIKELRREVRLCEDIAVRSLSIKEKIKAVREEARTEQGTRQGPEQGRAGIPGRR